LLRIEEKLKENSRKFKFQMVNGEYMILLLSKEEDAKRYLQSKGGYTKKYRTDVRLSQCGHLHDVEMLQ